MLLIKQDACVRESTLPYKIVEAARTCYQSKDKPDQNDEKFIKGLIKRGHTAMLEHSLMTVKFITSRAIANELVRHRHCAFAQESTRYCAYKKDVKFIQPECSGAGGELLIDTDIFEALQSAELSYKKLLKKGFKPEDARAVLPLCTATEIVVSANYREWMHIFSLRYHGTTGRPHPEFRSLMGILLEQIPHGLRFLFERECNG